MLPSGNRNDEKQTSFTLLNSDVLAEISDTPGSTVAMEETPFAEVGSIGPNGGCYATATAAPMDLPPSYHAIALANGDDAMQYFQGRKYPTATPLTLAEPKADYDARSARSRRAGGR